MNKNAIKKFAIDARNKLIASVTDKAGMLGITPDNCSEAITKGADFEVYKTAAGTEVTLNKKQCEQRRKLVDQIHARGFEAVVEEVAYTWFNRICAIRFMEVNDYMYPVRVRVLSSEKEGKNEPDVVTMAPEIDWDFTDKEREEIIDAKMNNRLDDLFRMLFIKQCNLLHEVLPGLFEETEDYTEMLLNISFTNEDDVIRMLIDEKRGIPEEDFNVNTIGEDGQPTGQVEIIGWLYQYYNTELKDDTFAKLKKNVKITKERIPAVTQLFTPDWIVRYMVENSVGRIWIEHLRAVDPSTDEKTTAEKFGWKYYLPEAEQEDEVNVKLAEIRTTYKDLKPTEITCIDPCMGSGHILIAMFDVLMDIYENAGYDKREAAFDIVEHNIHGLDIDKRAYQLAYFAVMMKGRGYNRRFLRGRDGKPEPKVYAIVESNLINRNHLQFFGTHLSDMERNLAVNQIERLLDTFLDAREYGSILNVDTCNWDVLEKFVDDLETSEQISFESVGNEETQNNLRKLIRVAKNLSQKYDAIVTNPPYMGNMPVKMTSYIQKNYEDVKYDLYAVFIRKSLIFAKNNGMIALITQHTWMFISSFEKMRESLMNKSYICLLHLGTRAFEEIGGEVVQTASFVLRNCFVERNKVTADRLVDFSDAEEKQLKFLAGENRYITHQNNFGLLPGNVIVYWLPEKFFNALKENKFVNDIVERKAGVVTGNDNYFLRLWFEPAVVDISWTGCQSNEYAKYHIMSKGGSARRFYGNYEYVIKLRDLWNPSKTNTSVRRGDADYYFKKAIGWSQVGNIQKTFRSVENSVCGTATPTIYLKNSSLYNYVLSFLNTKIAYEYLAAYNPTINLLTTDICNLPLIVHEELIPKVDSMVNECIKYEKIDWDSFETSWDFKRHPLVSVISQNRVLLDDTTDIDLVECYICWENECNERFNQLKANEEELNRIFIDIYGLQDELTPEVEDKDVTVRKADLQRDIKSLISYAVGCMFGRYSLDEEGLVLAGQSFESQFFETSAPVCGTGFAGASGASVPTGEFYYKTDDDVKKCTYNPDKDNIIPICDEEYFSDDIVSRFCEWVKIVYGEKSLETNLDFIAKALGNKGNTSREVIRNYFLNDFFKDHCNTYSVTGSGKRPIYWLFDSGKQNGFKALIYMHRYDADTVGRVRTDYLHRAQKYVETAMQSAQYTIDNATSSSEKSKATKAATKYTKQLAEMRIYDEAIAHVANQRIEIDLDDGVKVNYAKFQGVEVAQEGKKTLKVDLLAKI